MRIFIKPRTRSPGQWPHCPAPTAADGLTGTDMASYRPPAWSWLCPPPCRWRRSVLPSPRRAVALSIETRTVFPIPGCTGVHVEGAAPTVSYWKLRTVPMNCAWMRWRRATGPTGDNVELWQCNGEKNQEWNGEGIDTFYINEAHGLCLDARYRASGTGTTSSSGNATISTISSGISLETGRNFSPPMKPTAWTPWGRTTEATGTTSTSGSAMAEATRCGDLQVNIPADSSAS